MFYFASKVLTFVLQPSSLLWLALVSGLVIREWWPRFRRLGLSLSVAALAGLFAAGLTPLANVLVSPLENRFREHTPETVPQPVKGIILLGGAEEGWVTAGRSGLAVNEAAERITETARLALRFADAKLVIIGGGSRIFNRGVEGSSAVAVLMNDLGVAEERLIVEKVSRNTFENATLTLPLINAAPGETWLLVTSAFHMPRAVGVFRKAGLDVTAYPVDFRTRGDEDLTRWFPSLPSGLKRFDVVAKEWAGLIVYYLTGRTGALFPAP